MAGDFDDCQSHRCKWEKNLRVFLVSFSNLRQKLIHNNYSCDCLSHKKKNPVIPFGCPLACVFPPVPFTFRKVSSLTEIAGGGFESALCYGDSEPAICCPWKGLL